MPTYAFILRVLTFLAMGIAGVAADSTSFPPLKKALFTAVTLFAITLLSLANKRFGCTFILAMALLVQLLLMWFWN